MSYSSNVLLKDLRDSRCVFGTFFGDKCKVADLESIGRGKIL